MNKTFGEKLRNARTDAGLKQADLAKSLGVANTTISNWEKNISKPDLEMLSYICGVLNVKVSYFLEAKVPEDEVTLTEFNIIKKYRDLDDHGKKMVDFTLENEWKRSIMSKDLKGQISLLDILPNAAHERTDIEVTDEMRKHDDDIMDDENF